ncbi:hypothetical protein B296_00026419 [Ensete ventricosum]|uniref:Protein kinase domain-containing protein n=1 Tax=Ensete ventricosum TaxID=4639 RepID=A0A426YHC3_ENSVE|nr:hypothetical protein B296_00026419 [Ensete ventricosum]
MRFSGILATDLESSVKETGLLLDLPKVMDKGTWLLVDVSYSFIILAKVNILIKKAEEENYYFTFCYDCFGQSNSSACESLQQLSKTDFDASEQHWSSIMINSENANLHNERAGCKRLGLSCFRLVICKYFVPASVNISGALSSFDLSTIKAATNDFSADNKLGEGGFGAVYKVTF